MTEVQLKNALLEQYQVRKGDLETKRVRLQVELDADLRALQEKKTLAQTELDADVKAFCDMYGQKVLEGMGDFTLVVEGLKEASVQSPAKAPRMTRKKRSSRRRISEANSDGYVTGVKKTQPKGSRTVKWTGLILAQLEGVLAGLSEQDLKQRLVNSGIPKGKFMTGGFLWALKSLATKGRLIHLDGMYALSASTGK